MYLPTFWKLTYEATKYRARHMAGYGVPVGFFGIIIPLFVLKSTYSDLADVPLPVQLGVLMHYSSPQRCAQERRRYLRMNANTV